MTGDAVILVAEDSIVIRALLRAQLKERGYTVLEAADGEQALSRATEGRPDVILLDVEMPRLDGFGVLERLKRDPALGEIPVVFVSGRATAEDIVRGLEMGAHDYLRKPFEAAELAARVHAAVRTKRLHDDLRRLNEQLAKLARTDRLTGMANRRSVDEDLGRQCSRAARHKRPLSLLLLDIDGFAEINRRHGEAAGDQVLASVARRLQGRLRAEDVLGRWGGDELAVVAGDVDARAAAALAAALSGELSAHPVALGDDEIWVTAAVGHATWRGDSLRELVHRAEDALRRARELAPGGCAEG